MAFNKILGLAQVFYRHGRLRMYRQCQAVRVAGQDGLTIVVNGLVRISYRDPFGSHQQFFLGTGAPDAAPAPNKCQPTRTSIILFHMHTHAACLGTSLLSLCAEPGLVARRLPALKTVRGGAKVLRRDRSLPQTVPSPCRRPVRPVHSTDVR